MSDKPVEYGGTQYGGTEYGGGSYSHQDPQQQPQQQQQDNNPFSDNNYPSYPPPPQYQEPNPPASSPTYVSPTAPLPPPQQYPAPIAPQYPPQPSPYQPAHPSPYPSQGHPPGHPPPGHLPTETTVLLRVDQGGVLSGALVVESNPDTPRTLTELYPLLPLDYPGGWLAAIVSPEEHRDWGEKVNQEIEKQEDEYRAHLRTRRWLVWWFLSTIIACVVLFYVLGNDELSFFIIFLIVLTEFASIGLIIWYSKYKLDKLKSNVVDFANETAEQRFLQRGAVYEFESINRGSWLMDWRLTITTAS